MDRRPSVITRVRARETLDRFQTDTLELIDSVARHLGPARIAPERIIAAAEHLRPPPRHRMMPMLEQFAELRPTAFFVQVGSHDGQQQDPLRDIVLGHEWSGVMVEPVPYVFSRLKHHYGHLQRLKLENVAVGPEDGPRTFYHLRDTSDAGRAGLPIWFDALGSFDLEVVLAHRQYIPDIESRIVEIEVPCTTFDSLCRRNHVERVDFLHTDTEGYDFEILKSVPFSRFRPTLIVYESFHLAPVEKQQCVRYLEEFDYGTVEYGLDTWCFNRSTLPKSQADVLEPLWRWLTFPTQGTEPLLATRMLRETARRLLGRPDAKSDFAGLFQLTESQRRYLTDGYDDRTPLPTGAMTYLRTDSTRLRELAENYRSTSVPAVAPPERATKPIALRYFRGDNLRARHRLEHPRAMAMVLFIYMRYLESRGGRALLERLAEDGAFGAWTADVGTSGKLSRDRLESVSEILFLERHLGILGQAGIRILDFSGGYGRLAHRMSEAHPSVSDYCCVDESPESAFLTEYYLGFRGFSPPARVISPGELGALEPGSFDVAINSRGFSQCTLVASKWWLGQLGRLRVPQLFLMTKAPDVITSGDLDAGGPDVMPSVIEAGYRLTAVEPVIADPAIQEIVGSYGSLCLFAFEQSQDTPS